ncbi:MAG: hypothetical protein R2856_04125 [Caldilineaceae bacterium]
MKDDVDANQRFNVLVDGILHQIALICVAVANPVVVEHHHFAGGRSCTGIAPAEGAAAGAQPANSVKTTTNIRNEVNFLCIFFFPL